VFALLILVLCVPSVTGFAAGKSGSVESYVATAALEVSIKGKVVLSQSIQLAALEFGGTARCPIL